MGLRARIKGRIKKVLGAQEDAKQAAPTGVATVPSKPAASQTSQSPKSMPPVEASDSKKVTVAKASPVADSGDGRKPISEEKVKKHLLKTRKGVLKFVRDNGGSATLAEMHDYSERRYFVAHKKFSDLMEAMIADEQIDYNAAESVATLTETGKDFVEE